MGMIIQLVNVTSTTQLSTSPSHKRCQLYLVSLGLVHPPQKRAYHHGYPSELTPGHIQPPSGAGVRRRGQRELWRRPSALGRGGAGYSWRSFLAGEPWRFLWIKTVVNYVVNYGYNYRGQLWL